MLLSIWNASLNVLSVLSVCGLITGCVTPPSVRGLKDLKGAGELFYEEYRQHECGSNIEGFTCVYSCASYVWRYWQTEGAFERNVADLQTDLAELGFQLLPTDYGRELWSFYYETPEREVSAYIKAGTRTWTQGAVVAESPRSEVPDGKYVYGVQAGYETSRDHLVESWRNLTWMFRECDGNDRIGYVYRPR